jgi:2-keto-4-pentenoate hydratase
MTERVRRALLRQLARRRAVLDGGARHVGWKVGAGIEEVGGPVFGYLTSASVVARGGFHDVTGARALRAETELLIEVREEGLACGVALELVDTARPPGGMEEIVAENVFHRAVALGERRERPVSARLWVDGALREEVPVGTDPAAVAARLAAQLEACGERLRPGDLILGGSLIHVPVQAGCRLAAATAEEHVEVLI